MWPWGSVGLSLYFYITSGLDGWVTNTTPRPLHPREMGPVPILQESGLVLGPFWDVRWKSRHHRISNLKTKKILITLNRYIISRRTPNASHRRLIGDGSVGNWLLILKNRNECVKIVREKREVYSIKYKCLCNDQPV